MTEGINFGQNARPLLMTAARVCSVIFHPLFIMTYMLLLLLLINPYLFGVNRMADQGRLIMMVFFSTVFIPIVSISMMKTLGFVSSWEMEDRMDRIIPYISTAVWYLAIYYFLLKSPDVPTAYKTFMLGGIIALFAAFFFNNFTKVSIHTTGMGGLLGMVIITMTFFRQKSFLIETSLTGPLRIEMFYLLMFTILMAGVVGTSRLLLNAHRPRDLWGGYFIGLAAQFVALQIVF
ncbi:MAG TPA: hypothetical protein PKC40_00610 [Saprospiraceae bacterium]|nr:hypothetical protein [Saprospiraceae bacterium]